MYETVYPLAIVTWQHRDSGRAARNMQNRYCGEAKANRDNSI